MGLALEIPLIASAGNCIYIDPYHALEAASIVPYSLSLSRAPHARLSAPLDAAE